MRLLVMRWSNWMKNINRLGLQIWDAAVEINETGLPYYGKTKGTVYSLRTFTYKTNSRFFNRVFS
jgi:hypothetical protein